MVGAHLIPYSTILNPIYRQVHILAAQDIKVNKQTQLLVLNCLYSHRGRQRGNKQDT